MNNWKNNFIKDKEIVLVTASKKGSPNANIVVSLGFADEKLLVADCQMKTTIKNIKENPNICMISGYYRVKGSVKIFSSGKYFDQCVKNSGGYKVKNALLITIKKVFDLDKGEEIAL